MRNLKKNRQKGITLIALVVTIVVLIILATVSILAVFGDNGIIARAQTAKDTHEKGKADETNTLDDYASYIGNYLDGKGGSSGGGSDTPTKPAEGITATVEGKTVTITKDNVADYLGKVVTNYVPTATTVKIGANTYTVSNNYRLYYVDFDEKYGEKNGVYLKADCTSNNYSLQVTDTTESTASNVKIRALNPSLYKTGVTAPSADNSNMKAVTWLTNTSNWDSLKTGASIEDKVNYVVGAPSVEMMMDSYNTKYNLTERTPNTGALTADTARVKLFYQYPTTINSNNYGYEVGPSNDSSAKNGYYYTTSYHSVKTDSAIDSMYYPGSEKVYWLASPSAEGSSRVMRVNNFGGGYVTNYGYNDERAFCPLVSLKSTVSLQLQ